MLPALGAVLTVFPQEYVDYVDVKVKGPFKGEHYRYLSHVKELMNNAFINNMGTFNNEIDFASLSCSRICVTSLYVVSLSLQEARWAWRRIHEQCPTHKVCPRLGLTLYSFCTGELSSCVLR